MRNVLRFNAVADTFKRNFLIRKKTLSEIKKIGLLIEEKKGTKDRSAKNCF